MIPTEFITALSQRTNIPITQSKDFRFIEASGIRVLDHHHKIAVSLSSNGEQAQTRYQEPTSELMTMLVDAFKTSTKSHQQRLVDDRINHFKTIKGKKNV